MTSLEQAMLELTETALKVKEQRDELLAACETALDKIERGIGLSHMVSEQLRFAIRKAKA